MWLNEIFKFKLFFDTSATLNGKKKAVNDKYLQNINMKLGVQAGII